MTFEEVLRELGKALDELIRWVNTVMTAFPEEAWRSYLIGQGCSEEDIAEFLTAMKRMRR